MTRPADAALPTLTEVRVEVELEMGRVVKVIDRETWANIRAVLLYHIGTTDPETLHESLAARRADSRDNAG